MEEEVLEVRLGEFHEAEEDLEDEEIAGVVEEAAEEQEEAVALVLAEDEQEGAIQISQGL